MPALVYSSVRVLVGLSLQRIWMDGLLSLLPPLAIFLATAAGFSQIYALSIGYAVALISAWFLGSDIIPALLSSFSEALSIDTSSLGAFFQSILYSSTLHLFAAVWLLFFFTELLERFGFITEFVAEAIGDGKSISDARRTEFVISSLFFEDEYLGLSTAGKIASAIAEKVKQPKRDAAPLVVLGTFPLATLIPTTTWAAYILLQTRKLAPLAGVTPNSSDLALYLRISLSSIGPIFAFLGGLYLTFARHGPRENQNILGSTEKEPIARKVLGRIGLVHFLGLLVSVVLGLTLAGVSISGAIASAAAITSSALLFIVWRRGKFLSTKLRHAIASSVKTLFSVSALLTLAWAISSIMTKQLMVKSLVASLLGHNLSYAAAPLISFYSVLIGGLLMVSSWGAMAVSLPLIVPMVHSAPPHFLYIVVGAALSGAVLSNMLLPVSDMTLLTSRALGMKPVNVSKAVLPVSASGIVAASTTFLLVKFTTFLPGVVLQIFSTAIGALTGILSLYIALKLPQKH